MYTIKRGAGQDSKCANKYELQKTLESMPGEHIAVTWVATSGIHRTMFVSVDERGGVFDSYKGNEALDYEQLG